MRWLFDGRLQRFQLVIGQGTQGIGTAIEQLQGGNLVDMFLNEQSKAIDRATGTVGSGRVIACFQQHINRYGINGLFLALLQLDEGSAQIGIITQSVGRCLHDGLRRLSKLGRGWIRSVQLPPGGSQGPGH